MKKRARKSVSLLLVLVVFVAAFSFVGTTTTQTTEAATKNLLTNGTAEKGKLTGWKATSKEWKATNGEGYGAPCKPYKGKYFFWAYNYYDSKSTSLYQNVSVKSSYRGKTAVLSAYTAVWDQSPTDIAILRLTFYNSSGKSISTKYVDQKKAKYQKKTVKLKVPSKAAKMRVTLTGIRKNGMVDAYFDNVSLIIK